MTTAVQLYFGPNPSYANLPHNADGYDSTALNAQRAAPKKLNITITLNNNGPDVAQVYVNLYYIVCGMHDINTTAQIDALALTAMSGTPMSWNNLIVQKNSTWSSGVFQLKVLGPADMVVLVATVSCQPLNEGPSLSAPTQDPCVAVNVVPYP